VSFKYDPSGRRIQKALTQSAGNVITNYVYDGDSISETADASGTVTARYSQGQGIDEPLAAQNGGTVGYYHADGLGSVTSMTNASGALIQSYAYDSFGRQSSSTGSLQNPFQYTAREMDGETGLYYYRARYYDSQAGRFLNEDPSGFSSGENFYSYVDNDSVEFADPEGLCPLDDKKKHCPAKMPKNPRRRIMVQTLMGEMTGEGYVGSNQYADSQSGPTKATGEPDGPEITNETLDLEAELLAGTMLNLGKIGNTGTYRGLPAGQNLATKGLRSPDGSDLCIMLQRAIGAVNEAVDSPVPLSPFNHWKTSRQGNWVRPLDLSKTPALRIALTDFYY
jgi:RHS repeat-associated protein